ncbi:class III extradiol dioxygenase subunit B-like domain-containing protein [Amycolatopsis thermoflava]|uniref:class III extradiol dioxygenase subunit B-like domain-containing protein n=1 Tax=Amycolatopsis thermoflava TaxID=84480 RepID=UPI0036626950
MIVQAVVVPQPPLLVPALSPGSNAELEALRAACRAAVGRLAAVTREWVAVAAGDHERVIEPDTSGSFRGYGADVPVSLSAAPASPAELPLPALVAGWLREQAGADSVRVHLVDGDPAECERLGKLLANGDRTGLLVLGDGSNRHGPKSPGSEDERAPAFDEAVARALATADTAALRALDPGLAAELGAGGRAPWQVLAGAGDDWRAELLYSAAPFGVGYHVAVWERG